MQSLFSDGFPEAPLPRAGNRPPRGFRGGRPRGTGRLLTMGATGRTTRSSRWSAAVRATRLYRDVETAFRRLPEGRITPAPVESEPEQLSARRHLAGGDYKVFRGSLCFKVPHLSHGGGIPPPPASTRSPRPWAAGRVPSYGASYANRRELVSYVELPELESGERGLLWISYVCEPEDAERAESALWEVLGQVAEEGIDEAVVGKGPTPGPERGNPTVGKTMSGQASRLRNGGGSFWAPQLQPALPGPAQRGPSGAVREVARRYLVRRRVTAVGLGPGSSSVPASGAFDPARTAPRPFECLRMEGGATCCCNRIRACRRCTFAPVLLGGPLFEPEGRRGLSALLGELLTRGHRG